MRRYLLDSGILSDLINHRNGVRERTLAEADKGNKIGTALPILAEMAYGIEYGQNRDRNMHSLISVLPMLRLWPFDYESTFRYGVLAADLRRAGRQIQVIDLMAASIALTFGNCTIVSKDSDFNVIPGLTVENWAK